MRKLLTFLIALATVVGVTASSFGGSMSLMGVGRTGAAAPPTTTFQSTGATAGTNGTATPWTATGVGIGTSSATRRVIVIAAGGAGAPSVASGTIDGGGGPIAFSTPVVGGANQPISIMSAVVPVGTTATIVLTMTGAFFGASDLLIYTVDNSLLSSPTPVTSFSDAASATISGSVANLAGGFELVAQKWTAGGVSAATNSASSPALSTDVPGSNFFALSANGIPAGTGTATNTWSGAVSSSLMMAAFR
jgi:hypothetical protein